MSGATWFCSTYGELNSGWEKQSGREVWGATCWYRTSPSSDRFGPRFWSDILTNAFTKSRVVQLFEKYGSAGGSWTSNSAFPFREMSDVLFPPFLPSAAPKISVWWLQFLHILCLCVENGTKDTDAIPWETGNFFVCVLVWKRLQSLPDSQAGLGAACQLHRFVDSFTKFVLGVKEVTRSLNIAEIINHHVKFNRNCFFTCVICENCAGGYISQSCPLPTFPSAQM